LTRRADQLCTVKHRKGPLGVAGVCTRSAHAAATRRYRPGRHTLESPHQNKIQPINSSHRVRQDKRKRCVLVLFFIMISRGAQDTHKLTSKAPDRHPASIRGRRPAASPPLSLQTLWVSPRSRKHFAPSFSNHATRRRRGLGVLYRHTKRKCGID